MLAATPPLRFRSPVLSGALLTLFGLAVLSCGRTGDLSDASGPGAIRAEGVPDISTGLNALESSSSQGAPVSADADPGADGRTSELLDLMEQAQRHGSVTVDAQGWTAEDQSATELASTGSSPEANPGVAFSLPVEPDISVRIPEGALEVGVDDSHLPDEPRESREIRHQRLIGELAAMLDEQASVSATPAPTLVQIATLRFLQLPPARTIETSDNPGGAFGGAGEPLQNNPAGINTSNDSLDAYLNSAALSPGERDMLEAWKDFVFHAGAALLQFNDLSSISVPAQDLADALGAWKPLAIAVAKLCNKVEGYGVYNELRKFDGGHKFLVGRSARMIVYIEPVNFQRTSASRDGVWGHQARLTQDLRLFHAAKDADTLVWRKPDQEIDDFSRNRRRDFFVVQVIELPANLGVGSYRLKVIMTDKANGAVAETIIPIEIVADASALQE